MRLLIVFLFLPFFVFAQNKKATEGNFIDNKWQYEKDLSVVFPKVFYVNKIKTNVKTTRFREDLSVAEKRFLKSLIISCRPYFSEKKFVPTFQSGATLNFSGNSIFIIPPDSLSNYFYIVDTYLLHIDIYYVQFGSEEKRADGPPVSNPPVGGFEIFEGVKNLSKWFYGEEFEERNWLPKIKKDSALRK